MPDMAPPFGALGEMLGRGASVFILEKGRVKSYINESDVGKKAMCT